MAWRTSPWKNRLVRLRKSRSAERVKASDLFEFPESLPFASHFDGDAAPWDWVPQIKKALAAYEFGPLEARELPPGVVVEGQVYLHPTVKLPPFCQIAGPAWIGPEVEIRPGAFIRGTVIVGAGSVLGNSCEFKNCLLLEKVQAPHFSYVGDSILGNRSHLGAGVILSNLRLDQKPVKVSVDGEKIDTGLRKLGALVGDEAEAGCNAVLNPGSILGRRALVGPLVAFRGTLKANALCLNKGETMVTERGD